MLAKQYFSDLAALFFPRTCVGCDAPLVRSEQLICTSCWFHLPYTHAHEDLRNSGTRQFWGRIPLAAVASYWYFRDESRVKRIIHHLKYRGCPEIGTLVGVKYGGFLRETAPFNQAEAIVPVPLHPKKLRQRGYNQSVFFAEGLSHSMKVPVLENCLLRNKATASQTHKNRYERYENMLDTFAVQDADAVAGKHILLVDDVITTGATLEACAYALSAGGAAKVSAVTIAKAR